ncbi:hypothetical protein TNCV_3377941 [Trichonephila clavipes]|nr:hypothetical protein TNCV_3377941 [Trichonephila clavipes]
MGGRRSPKFARQFVHLPCLQETDLKGISGMPQVNGLYGGRSCILAQLVGQSEFFDNLKEGRSDGRSSVPKVTTAVCTFAGNGFKKNFGDASGQRTLWRAKLYPCTACWPIGIVKFTARTLKRMIFRVVRSPLYKGWRANSRGFLLLLRLPEKPSTAGKRTCYPRSTPSVALSIFQS